MKTYKNYTCFCLMCGKLFIMEEYEGNWEIQIHKLKSELGHYKANNKQLQFKIKKENYFWVIIERESLANKIKIKS